MSDQFPEPTLNRAWMERSAPAEDRRTDICPYCGGQLKKIPAAKTKCPHCGNSMYVRVDPRINARVVVTQAGLEGIEDANAVAHGTWEERRQDKIDRAAVRDRLAQNFGPMPDEADVSWGFLNKKFMRAVACDDGYSMFTTACEMTDQLVREKKYPEAVRMVARVVVNNWVNSAHDIPPAWVGVVEKALSNGVTVDEARDLFIGGAAALHAIPCYRVDASEIWDNLANQLDA